MTLAEKIDDLISAAIERFAKNDAFNFTDIIKKFVSKDSKSPHLENEFEKFFKDMLDELVTVNPSWAKQIDAV